MKTGPHILLVNPYIRDFSAFDLWSKPLGLLYLAAVLRADGYRVHWLDCLDVHFPGAGTILTPPRRGLYGTGKYFQERLPKPWVLRDVPRYYYRFGIPPDLFLQALRATPEPVAVLVTSLMTYWYPGITETIGLIKQVFPRVPVVLGGVYAGLMPNHARENVGADHLITGAGEGAILNFLGNLTGRLPSGGFDPDQLDSYPFPAFDLYSRHSYVCLLTSRGCPFSCPYCASRLLQSGFRERSVENIVAEIRHWHTRYGVRDFVFYDDALLIHFENRLGPVLEQCLQAGWPLRFHAPNALHLREINPERAALLFRSGFQTIRLGLETTDWRLQQSWGGKVNSYILRLAVSALQEAGFEAGRLEVYLLAGLPGQTVEDITRSIVEVKKLGLGVRLAEYSPIPGTVLWEEACRSSRFPLDTDPLLHNNSLFPCFSPFSWETVQQLKDLAR
ncbi:MAG: B12-binding domain-containing radical SAM protein [Deltaproteobacteria bacterium]|nr:B12-binding domain-containing radical SAM protein [Deltaproteobacteria bacterium]